MYNLLKGKKGIIFGALINRSIAWKVAERAHEEGAEFVLTNTPCGHAGWAKWKNWQLNAGTIVIPAAVCN